MIPLNHGDGEEAFNLIKRLWSFNRSITGSGVRQTLHVLQEQLNDLKVFSIPTGTKCFDWTVPKEWNVDEAYIITPEGKRIADFSKNNLHLLGYSTPIEAELDLEELQKNLYSLPDDPSAIPYVTSYYQERWGFCISDDERKKLVPGKYKVVVKTKLFDGVLNYGELVIRGKSDREILISTYVCHPSMANNELSGPAVAWSLAKWLSNQENEFTYRIIFLPETIGSICYLSKHFDHLRKKVVAGFVLTCVGDERAWSYMPSREGNLFVDRICKHMLNGCGIDYVSYSFLDRGSDERQYCSPKIDLPVAYVMRSKYATFPEYHTSLDDLNLVSAKGLGQTIDFYKKLFLAIEANCVPEAVFPCEPKMSDRGLRSSLGTFDESYSSRDMMNLLAYADGKKDLLHISEIIGINILKAKSIVKTLEKHGLIKVHI